MSLPQHRTVFYISDGTGITAEALGSSLLTQFESVVFHHVRLPFVNSIEKAFSAKEKINQQTRNNNYRPIAFSTLIDPQFREIVRQAHCCFFDLFATFGKALEAELGVQSTRVIGKSHTASNTEVYDKRIAAINFTLSHDDGQSDKSLNEAEVILIGVSRSGKTPTSLYLAIQHGIRVANYPLIPEDFQRSTLPKILISFKKKLFGLSITAKRLSEVRSERRPNSEYASLANCLREVQQAERLMQKEGIPWLSSTSKSIEEIATNVLQILESREKT